VVGEAAEGGLEVSSCEAALASVLRRGRLLSTAETEDCRRLREGLGDGRGASSASGSATAEAMILKGVSLSSADSLLGLTAPPW